MNREAIKLALEAAYLAGFNASGEGYNGEYPFRDHNTYPEQDAGWMRERDKHVEQALAEQRSWVGLTDEQIDKLFGDGPYVPAMLLRNVARAIEAKLKEKNT